MKQYRKDPVSNQKRKFLIFFLITLGVLLYGFTIVKILDTTYQPEVNSNVTDTTDKPTSFPTLKSSDTSTQSLESGEKNNTLADVIALLKTILPYTQNFQWGELERTTGYNGFMHGYVLTGYTMSQTGIVYGFGNTEELENNGWEIDQTLESGGIDGVGWGYRKTIGNKKQLMIFSSQNKDITFSSDGYLTFTCPCKVQLNVFVSDLIDPQ